MLSEKGPSFWINVVKGDIKQALGRGNVDQV